MDYQKPTTKAELISVLKEMFHYYRIKREFEAQMNLTALNLPSVSAVVFTEEQLTERAKILIAASHEREKKQSEREINEKLSSIDSKLSSAEASAESLIAEINELYDASEDKIRKEAESKGFANSNAVLEKIAKLESEKNAKIAEITEDKEEKVAELQAEKEALEQRFAGLESYFTDLYDKDVSAKVVELTDEQNTRIDNTNKYNNTVKEKNVNSKNGIIQAQANLELKYRQINAEMLTKDALVDMGYYQDVIDCINDYYSTMSASDAYKDFLNETRLVVYLDDYYQDLLYLYKIRAGA